MSILIVASIIIILSGLACYTFIKQSIDKKRIQRQRILMALKTKQRNFTHLINGFPQQFLSSELSGLIYRALIDTCEQLHAIEPEEAQHREDITLYTNQLASLTKNTAQRARLDNPEQMKEIRKHLVELQNFITHQESSKQINKTQADTYNDQIKRLILQMSVDHYLFQGKQAQQAEKTRLAIHFFNLAKKLLASENATRIYDKQITQLDVALEKLEAKISAESPAVKAPQNELGEQWENIKTPEDSWKKKNIYD